MMLTALSGKDFAVALTAPDSPALPPAPVKKLQSVRSIKESVDM